MTVKIAVNGWLILDKPLGMTSATAVARVRSSQRDEAVGLDVTQHGEEAYTRGDGAVLVMPSITAADTRSTDESMRVPLGVPA